MSRGKTVKPPGPQRSDCPLACALEIWGDRWSLILIRDLYFGKRRFNELLDSPEGITTNILADRLKRLEQAGVVRRQRYQERPPRFEYSLTAAGKELLPVIREAITWSRGHVPGTRRPGPG